jgi:hypothetical protein
MSCARSDGAEANEAVYDPATSPQQARPAEYYITKYISHELASMKTYVADDTRNKKRTAIQLAIRCLNKSGSGEYGFAQAMVLGSSPGNFRSHEFIPLPRRYDFARDTLLVAGETVVGETMVGETVGDSFPADMMGNDMMGNDLERPN